MVQNPISDFEGKVHPSSMSRRFQYIHHPQALNIMLEPAGMLFIQKAFPVVSERSMPEVMAHCDRFRQVLIQSQRSGDGPGDLGNLQRMSQPGTKVVAFRCQKYLGFMHKPSEGLRMDDPVPVPLIVCPHIAFWFVILSPLRLCGLGGKRR